MTQSFDYAALAASIGGKRLELDTAAADTGSLDPLVTSDTALAQPEALR